MAEQQGEETAGWAARWRDERRRKRAAKSDSPEKLAERHTPKPDIIDRWVRSGGIPRKSRFKL